MTNLKSDAFFTMGKAMGKPIKEKTWVNPVRTGQQLKNYK